MPDIKEMLKQKVAERVKQVDRFDILFITDGASRMYNLRGITAMEDFARFYDSSGKTAKISLVTMDSTRACQLKPDFSKFSIVWFDNVANRELSRIVDEQRLRITEDVLPGWKEDLDDFEKEIAAASKKYEEAVAAAEVAAGGPDHTETDEEQAAAKALKEIVKERDEYLADVAEYRAISSTRFIYALDEFIWEGPIGSGRSNTVNYVKTVEDLIVSCDALVVPNTQMAKLIGTFRFVGNKDIAVVPTFMSERFYPVNKIFKRAGSNSSSIRKPKILFKGPVIPTALQNYIFYYHDKADITISTGGVLQERVYKLLCEGKIKNIVHWSHPNLSDRALLHTQAVERDVPFDFVILTMPDDPADCIYCVADADTDALEAVACGAVAIAQIDDINYDDGVHICKETGLTFGHSITVEKFVALITKWSSCVSWDNAHEKQRKLLDTRMVGSDAIMGSYYGVMCGKLVSAERADTIKKMLADGDTAAEAIEAGEAAK